MKKVDYKKEHKNLYSSSAKKVSIVDVPQMQFLMIDGFGDPNTSREFQEAVEALFSVSYTLKFMIKKGEWGVDYGVMPLEGLWWADDMSQFNVEAKDSWKWTLMIMQPEFITGVLIAEAMETVQDKKTVPVASMLRFESFEEGKAAQIMHIGPFSEEGSTVENLHDFIEENSFKRCGKHHEIYLSDIRRANPEKWRTVIRQPLG